jgi:hypothetical protein
MKAPARLVLALEIVTLHTGFASTLPFGITQAEWDALPPQKQSELRRIADTAKKTELREFNRDISEFRNDGNRTTSQLEARNPTPLGNYGSPGDVK